MSASPNIDSQVLDEAAAWLVRMQSGPVSEAERTEWEDWCRRSEVHQRAWSRAERLMGKLGSVPAALAMPALDHPPRASRRALLAKLSVLLALGPAVGIGWRLTLAQGWTADYRTATGERREVTLPDGTQLMLSTASAVDLQFDDTQRRVLLCGGEILVQTAHDVANRPFIVISHQGRMHALGTRFSVRQGEGETQIAVLEGAVRITPEHGAESAALALRAGQKTRFTASAVDVPAAADEAELAWTRGMLMADRMPLATVAQELQRWRGGFVQVDPAIAALPVSGSFPIAEPERAITMLLATYPVQVETRWQGWRLRFVPR